MNSLKSFILLLGLAFALPWFGLVVYPSIRLEKSVVPVAYGDEDEAADPFYPTARRAVTRGAEVYAKNGCAYCHTQMIRPTYAGTDRWRPGWSGREEDGLARESLPHDYLGEKYAHLGIQRNGPDLSNVGYRIDDPQWHYRHFYDPRAVVEGSIMPAYRSLFERREVIGQVADDAVDVYELDGRQYQVTPTGDARALVGYLMSMKKDQAVPKSMVVR